MIVNLYAKDRWRIDCKYGTRVVFPSDSERVLNFVRKEFPDEKRLADGNKPCFT